MLNAIKVNAVGLDIHLANDGHVQLQLKTSILRIVRGDGDDFGVMSHMARGVVRRFDRAFAARSDRNWQGSRLILGPLFFDDRRSTTAGSRDSADRQSPFAFIDDTEL